MSFLHMMKSIADLKQNANNLLPHDFIAAVESICSQYRNPGQAASSDVDFYQALYDIIISYLQTRFPQKDKNFVKRMGLFLSDEENAILKLKTKLKTQLDTGIQNKHNIWKLDVLTARVGYELKRLDTMFFYENKRAYERICLPDKPVKGVNDTHEQYRLRIKIRRIAHSLLNKERLKSDQLESSTSVTSISDIYLQLVKFRKNYVSVLSSIHIDQLSNCIDLLAVALQGAERKEMAEFLFQFETQLKMANKQNLRYLDQVYQTQKAILQLKPGQRYLAPAGFISLEVGHADIIEFVRLNDNKFTMKVIETGRVLQLEPVSLRELQNFFNQTCSVFVAPDLSADEFLNGRLIADILAPEFIPSATSKEGMEAMSRPFVKLHNEGRLKRSEEKIAAQVSGTCSYSAPFAWMTLQMDASLLELFQLHMMTENLEKIREIMATRRPDELEFIQTLEARDSAGNVYRGMQVLARLSEIGQQQRRVAMQKLETETNSIRGQVKSILNPGVATTVFSFFTGQVSEKKQLNPQEVQQSTSLAIRLESLEKTQGIIVMSLFHRAERRLKAAVTPAALSAGINNKA